MKKIFTLLVLLAACVFSMQAQTRYVIAFDCTRSMNHPTGDYTKNGEDPYKIWIPAKKSIHSLWTQAYDNDEFVILLYQKTILHTIKGFKGSQLSDWDFIESKMEDAITHTGNTCIFHAWEIAEQYFKDFTGNCDFYFITDGVEDHDNKNEISLGEQKHIDDICKKIDEFCNLRVNGFYSNLKQSENDNINNQISEKIKSSCFKDLIAGNITPLSLSLGQEDLSKGKKTFNLVFEPVDNQRVADVQKLAAVFVNHDGVLEDANTYFRPVISGITDNNIELSIEHIKPVPQSLLDQSNSCKLFLRVTSLDEDVAIIPQLITVDVRYYYEKIAYLPSLELEGASKYHPAFCITPIANLFSGCDFIAEHKPDTITFDFKKLLDDNVLFNNEAIKHGSSYKLQLVPLRDKDKNAKFILLKNGEICKNNTIDVASSDANLLIKIIFYESSDDGTFKFKLVPIEPCKLDKINECANIEEASIPIEIEFDKNCNSLELLLLLLLCVLLTCCILRILYSHLRRGVTCGIDYIINDSQEVLVKRRKANKIVISSKLKNQNWIDWLFNGKTLYNTTPVPGLKSDICFESARLKRTMRLRCQENKDYLIDGSKMRKQILTANEDIKHVITDINNIELLILIVF